MAKILTYPERVNRYNLERMRELVKNGTEMHPGANYVMNYDESKKEFSEHYLLYGQRK